MYDGVLSLWPTSFSAAGFLIKLNEELNWKLERIK
jgi:hypothetical protein